MLFAGSGAYYIFWPSNVDPARCTANWPTPRLATVDTQTDIMITARDADVCGTSRRAVSTCFLLQDNTISCVLFPTLAGNFLVQLGGVDVTSVACSGTQYKASFIPTKSGSMTLHILYRNQFLNDQWDVADSPVQVPPFMLPWADIALPAFR